VVVLQNCTDLLDGELGSSTETCVTSSDDENKATSVKLEEVKKENEDPLSSPLIKTDPLVSFV
jgi:hypothetical protein